METIVKDEDKVFVPMDDETPMPAETPVDFPEEILPEPAPEAEIAPVYVDPENPDIPAVVGEPDAPTPEGTIRTVTLGEFFGTLQESVTIAWRYHLKTRKHYVHVELNNFYYSMLSKVDRLIEESQAIFGIIGDYVNTVFDYGKDELTYLNELRGYIVANRNDVISKEFTELHSALDDVLGEIDSIIYKLTTFQEPAIQTFEAFCYEHYDRLYESEEKDYTEDEDADGDETPTVTDGGNDPAAFNIPDDEDEDDDPDDNPDKEEEE